MALAYTRALLKLSGEALAGEKGSGPDFHAVEAFAVEGGNDRLGQLPGLVTLVSMLAGNRSNALRPLRHINVAQYTGSAAHVLSPEREPTSVKLEPTSIKFEPTSIKLEPTSVKFEPTSLRFEPTSVRRPPSAHAPPAACCASAW